MICSLVIGPAGHGVVRLAVGTAAGRLVRVETPGLLRVEDLGHPSVVHVHYTDRLFGERCEESAECFTALVRSLPCPVVVTLHDLPMPPPTPLVERRRAAYRRVSAVCAGVVVSSAHEAALLAGAGAHPARTAVIPLPIDRLPGTADASALGAEVGVLGWVYPGKGHDTVLRALPAELSLVALGAASPGHDDLVSELQTAYGRRFRITGFLDDATLLTELRRVGVPVAPGASISASASVGHWLAAGRRPIVLDGDWVRELEQRCPGAVTVVAPTRLGEAMRHALAHPETTLLGDVPVGPGSAGTAAAIAAFCEQVG